MKMRSHRRGLMVWSPPGSPADRYGAPAFIRLERPRPIRRLLRTGALLTLIGITRLARALRAYWRFVFTVTGALLVVIGAMLPSGGAFLLGLPVLLLALLGGPSRSHCRAADQMTATHWHA
jgi:hypothetical protein